MGRCSTKCGYTLPQVDATAGAPTNPLNRGPPGGGNNPRSPTLRSVAPRSASARSSP